MKISPIIPVLAIAAAAFALVTPVAAEGDAVLLKSKLAIGKTYHFRQDVVMKMQLPLAGAGESSTKMVMDLAMAVAAAPDGDNKLVTTKFTKVKMEMDMAGQKMVYDSTDPDKQSPLLKAQFAGLSDKEFKAIYDKDDKFIKMEGGDGGGGIAGGLGMGFGKNEIQQMLQQLTDYGFPTDPVKPGDKWKHKQEAKMGQMGNMKVSMEFTYKGQVERDGKSLAEIAITGGVGAKGEGGLVQFKDSTMSGSMFFDTELGIIHSSEVNMDMTMAVGGANGAEMDTSTKSTYTLLSIE